MRGRGGLSVNARYTLRPITGVERAAREIEARLVTPHSLAVPPSQFTNGLLGHGWEQTALPRRACGWLWSPCNTGPVRHRQHVVTIHDIAPIRHPEWFGRSFAQLYRHLTPALCRNAAMVVTDLRVRADELLELGASESRVRVIPLGVAKEFSPTSRESIERVRRQLGIGSHPYVLTVGSVEPRKNLDRLLAAWTRLGSGRGDHVLVVAGGHNERVFREMLGAQHDAVVHLGRVANGDLPALLSGATAFVSISLYEGFGLPPLEALACGTPVVASDIDAHRETMHDTATLFVDPYDVDSIVSGLKHALTADLVVDHDGLRKRFDWARTAADYDDLFTELSGSNDVGRL